MDLKKFKNAIFDLDGTLLDSMVIWESVDVDFLNEFGHDVNDEFREKIKSTSLKNAPKVFKSIYDIPLTEDEIYIKITTMGVELYQSKVELKPYVLEFLEYLKSIDIKMCVATASLRSNVEHVLKRLDIEHYFDFIICADDLTTGKDDPQIWHQCIEKFSVDKKDTIVFEDAYHAIETAKNAGFTVCAVYDEVAKDDKANIISIADSYVEHFGELLPEKK